MFHTPRVKELGVFHIVAHVSGLASEDDVVDFLRLMREASFSTQGVEQQHASLTLLHRMHPELSAETLSLRAMLHQTRHLYTDGRDAKVNKEIQRTSC